MMTASIIAFLIGEFPMEMTLLSLLIGLCAAFKHKQRATADCFLGPLFFFAVGLTGLWGFTFHAFYPQIAAGLIGWQVSPFQFEVAMANLGMGVIGIFGVSASRGYRIAGTLFVICFLWGAAFGHVVQMITAHNFMPGNAGLIFYNDVILPLLLIIFLMAGKSKVD